MAKIMIVDDDQDIRQLVTRFLEKNGHRVIPVMDGAYAMEDIRKERPDLIILDILMPWLDGATLGCHLKCQSEFKNIPVLILTSLADGLDLSKKIKADYFMAKPFNGNALVEKVNEITSNRKALAELDAAMVKHTNKKGASPVSLILDSLRGSVFRIFHRPVYSVYQWNKIVADTIKKERTRALMPGQMFSYCVPAALLSYAWVVFIAKMFLK